MERIHLSTIIFIAAFVWSGALLARGIPLSPQFFDPFSVVSGAVMLALAIFERWGWRWRILQGWFVKRPLIWGTWEVSFTSDWQDPTTGIRVGERRGYMEIRQTFTEISMRLMTDESSSELLGSAIVRVMGDLYRLSGLYRNEPRQSVRHRSEMHHGALVLDVQGTPPAFLDGHYWTDRKTTGEMKLTNRRKAYFGSFAAADAAFAMRRST